MQVFNIRLSKDFCIIDQNRLNDFLDTVKVKVSSVNFVTTNSTDYWSVIIFYTKKKEKTLKIEDNRIDFRSLTSEEKQVFMRLKEWRNNLANELGWSNFRICHNSHLITIVKNKPLSLEELALIKGFGKNRIEKYGKEILQILNF